MTKSLSIDTKYFMSIETQSAHLIIIKDTEIII